MTIPARVRARRAVDAAGPVVYSLRRRRGQSTFIGHVRARRRDTRMLTRVWDGLLDVDRFVRLHFVFFSCLWPLLGALSVHAVDSPAHIALLVVVGLSFHLFAFVLNDILDLPIDRTQPLRQRDPLVRGAIKPWQAMALVLVQPIAALAITIRLDGGSGGVWALTVAYAAMTVYNLWGKRCAIPPVTDFVQGMAWGALPIHAAFISGATPNSTTWLIAAYALVYTLFMNGIHGGLRDLANDSGRNARTTAIFLGARPSPGGGDPYVPSAVALFACTTLAGLIVIQAALLVRNAFGYNTWTMAWTMALIVVIDGGAIVLMPTVMAPRREKWDMAFRVQIYLALMGMPAVFIAAASAPLLVTLIILKVVSLAVNEWTAAVMRLILVRSSPPRYEGQLQ